MGELYIITGPPGIGKTTVSRLLADRKPKSAFIDGDDIYYLVHSGVTKPWSLDNHLEVFWENIISLINNFTKKGYDTVFNYICMPEDIMRMQNRLENTRIHVCVLIANQEVLINRDQLRQVKHQMGERSVSLLNEFMNQDFESRFYLDSSDLTPQETVDIILSGNKYILNNGGSHGILSR